MNWAPSRPTRNPDQRLRKAADADDAARQGVLDQPAGRPGEEAGHRTERQGDVDHRDEDQVDGRRTANRQPRQGRLKRERTGERDDDADSPHFLLLAGLDDGAASRHEHDQDVFEATRNRPLAARR